MHMGKGTYPPLGAYCTNATGVKLRKLPLVNPYIGGALSAVHMQCARSATIWACGRSRNPYFVVFWAYNGYLLKPIQGEGFGGQVMMQLGGNQFPCVFLM